MIIAERFNGPPGSGNGGYSAGLVGSYVDSPAPVVTLRVPPPLDTPLTVSPDDAGGVRVHDPAGVLIAEAAPSTLGPDAVVAPVTAAEAAQASKGYPGFVTHPFPTCFVCGPDRAPGDGLRLFPGPVGDGRTATPWRVPEEISPELVWACLDCPGGWAVALEVRAYVLGRMTAQLDALPRPGDECVVTGVMLAEDGRKAHVLTTLYGPDGAVLARSRATWLALAER